MKKAAVPIGSDASSTTSVTAVPRRSARTASGRQEHIDSDASSESVGPVSM